MKVAQILCTKIVSLIFAMHGAHKLIFVHTIRRTMPVPLGPENCSLNWKYRCHR